MFTLLVPFLACLAGIQAAEANETPTPTAPAPQVTISSLPVNTTLLVNFMANPANLANPNTGDWYDHTNYTKIDDFSAGLPDDNDKKPPFPPQNNDTQVLLGQIKFEDISNVPRLYSWMPKLHSDGNPYQNCSLTIHTDPHVSEIWVWADTQMVEAKVEGKILSKQKLKEYDSQAIKAECKSEVEEL